jgi:hypothetical protein
MSLNRAQVSLKKNLAEGRLTAAASDLSEGATLDPPTPAAKRALLWAALGAGDNVPAVQLAGWDWLARHDFTFPQGQAAHEVIRRVVRQHPLVLAQWLIDRTPDMDNTFFNTLGIEAVRRQDTAGLDWLDHEKWLIEPCAPEPCLLFQAAVSRGVDALANIEWLVAKGFTVREPAQLSSSFSNTAQTPLVHVAEQYRKLHDELASPYSPRGKFQEKRHAKLAAFPKMWNLLVSAGDDPDTVGPSGQSARQWIQNTPAADWQQAVVRQGRSQDASFSGKRARHRP